MIDETNNAAPVVLSAEPTLPRGHSLIAWVLIIGLVVFGVLLQRRRSEKRDEHQEASGANPIMVLSGKLLVGVRALADKYGDQTAASMLQGQIEPLGTGPIENRLCYIVLVGELGGPEAASKTIQNLQTVISRDHVNLTADQQRLLDILTELYASYQVGRYNDAVGEADRQFLEAKLRWLGALALAPPGGPDQALRKTVLAPAERTAAAIGCAIVVGGLLMIGGLFGLIFVIVYGLGPKSRTDDGPLPHAGVYAETFALWLAAFWPLTLAAPYVAAGKSALLVNGLLTLASLAVLAWPVLRGIPWRQVRQDIGLVRGPRGWLEPLIGLGCYAMSLSLIPLGLATVIALLHLQNWLSGSPSQAGFGLGSQPSHPIVGIAAAADAWGKLQVLLLACVIAPLLEETMFRGVLYRNLRGSTTWLGYGLSVFFSATVVSFIFAVIHPQGIIFVPLLMSLAYGFALAREWRGTLIPGMVAHGFSNGVLMTLLMLGTSG